MEMAIGDVVAPPAFRAIALFVVKRAKSPSTHRESKNTKAITILSHFRFQLMNGRYLESQGRWIGCVTIEIGHSNFQDSNLVDSESGRRQLDFILRKRILRFLRDTEAIMKLGLQEAQHTIGVELFPPLHR